MAASGVFQPQGARIFLPRTGPTLTTPPLLDLRLAQARARDAVHAPTPPLPDALRIHSAAPDRATFLMRPDLGRTLDPASQAQLAAHAGAFDLAILLADGLSPAALAHAPALLDHLRPHLHDWAIAPLVAAEQARVALGDPVAAALGARAALVLIGERPGLSTPASLGAYLTWAPGPHTTDADRNCVSNIHPAGLLPADAALTLAFLLAAARAANRSGVHLKDDSNPALAALSP